MSNHLLLAGPGDRPRVSWLAGLDRADFPRLGEVAGLLAVPGDEAQYLSGVRGILAGARRV